MRFQNPFPYVLMGFLFLASCSEKEETKKLFQNIAPETSGLKFNNKLTENDSVNIIDNEFVYNGAGVALGDLNNDGKDDIFFAGNQVDNALYLNEGKLKFKDITAESGASKPDSLLWSSGVSILDINLDGKQDIYICNTFYKDSTKRRNLLYINQGLNSDNIPSFIEMAKEYGVADTSYSSHAQFFDYDNDGDLDLFIGVNRIEGIDPSDFRPLTDDGSSMSKDRLYENISSDSLPHPIFEDVSEKAGIRFHGYSHSTLIHDFNDDGWLDIYVANDFFSNDLIYINNQDGTFTNKAGDIFKHFSLSSMGSDISDINNDGNMDIFTTEMQPYYNKRKKLFQGPSSYQKEIFTRTYDYEYQYARNTLQLNLGTSPSSGLPIFAETGMFAGVQETDWSWAPLFADYDNDGWKDLLITNGFPKDVTDRDFGDFRNTASRLISKEKLIAEIPEIKVPNFVFKNNGDLTFEDVTDKWGLNFGTYSNGAAYGDLDQDGDLDLVINNINDPAILLENHTDKLYPEENYLRVSLSGSENNPAALGAVVTIFGDGFQQKQSLLSGRGYLSKPENVLHFGLGKQGKVDSIQVIWPGGNVQRFGNATANQQIDLSASEAEFASNTPESGSNSMLAEVSSEYQLLHQDRDIDFIDFNFQRTLPHKFSQYGPALAVGDVNGDGLDDLFVSGSRTFKQKWFIQQADGTFLQQEVVYKENEQLEEEDAGTLLFDADSDGDLDLYIARGCAQYPSGHKYYQDLLLINDGSGNFTDNSSALPGFRNNSSTVKAADFDQDGDLDLFVGSRVLPFSYPQADRSYILRNESKDGQVRFVDATEEVCEALAFPGLISDALWTDFNGDSKPDLILAGEWMPLRFFENTGGTLREITENTGIQDHSGWWNSLSPADLDNDGDMDYIAGNFGRNSYFKGSKEEPVRVYAKDLDSNGMIDPLISYYLRDSLGTKKEYLYHPWQDVVKQYVGIRKRFNSFGSFGESTLPEMFSDGLLSDAMVLSYNYMQSAWIENLGDGKFELHSLPTAAQLAPVYGIQTADLDKDGFLDILLVGNDYGLEVQQGRADAFVGLALQNTGSGNFKPIPLEDSHFFVPGDAKSLVRLAVKGDKLLWIASQNNDVLKVFQQSNSNTKSLLRLQSNEMSCIAHFDGNAIRKHEFYLGDSFQSQSSRVMEVDDNVRKLEFFDSQGRKTRELSF